MKNKNSQNTQPSSTREQLRRMRQLTMATLAIASFAPADSAIAQGHSPEKPKVERSGFRSPNTLPGYNKPLKPEVAEALKQSAIKVGFRYKGSTQWNASCTGIKVNIGSGSNVSTAAHCFSNFTGIPRRGLINASSDKPKAYDFAPHIDNTGVEFGIFAPSDAKNKQRPLGIVSGISISARNQDWALLRINPTKDDGPEMTQQQSFASLPGIRLATEQIKAVHRPQPGQKVALFGMPQATGDLPLAGTGRYLGRIYETAENGRTTPLDVVGINPRRADQDNCNFGESGTSFGATVGNSIYMSGPLSIRNNAVYDPYLMDRTDASQPGDITNEIAYINHWREIDQQRLGIDLSGFSTICKYSVNLPDTVHDMVSGFGVAPPEELAPVGKGGGPYLK